MTLPQYAELIRNIPDFPIPGIQFKDITPLLADPSAFAAVVDDLATPYTSEQIDIVAGVEARGYIFSAPLAIKLGAGLVPIRKPGKLPATVVEVEYSLEYGTNRLQIHQDAIQPGARVLLVDDLLATGGTMAAAVQLIEQLGGVVVGLAFVIELSFLEGRNLLGTHPVRSLIRY